MKTWTIAIIQFIARLVLVAASYDDQGYNKPVSALLLAKIPGSSPPNLRQGRVMIDSASSSSSSLVDDSKVKQHASSKFITSSNNNAGVVLRSGDRPDRSFSSLRGLSKEDEDQLVNGTSDKTKSPTRSPWVGVQPIVALQSPIVTSPTAMVPTPVSSIFSTTAPVPTPTTLPVRLPFAPTGAPNVPVATPISTLPISLSPTFNNNRQTETLALNPFEVSIKANVDESLDKRAVTHVFRIDIRKATQIYLKEMLPYQNLLYVQLYPLEGRRNLLDIAESFSYGGDAVFLNQAPVHSELIGAQQRVLNDTKTFQGYIHNEDTLINVQLIEAVFRTNEIAADHDDGRGSISLIAVIAVASGVALAVLVLLFALICKMCRRQRHPPPPPVITAKQPKKDDEFNPYGEGTNTTDTDDEGAKPLEQLRRLDIPRSSSNATGETHMVGTLSSDASEPSTNKQSRKPQDSTLKSILRAKKPVPEHLYSVPMIEKADSCSGDSMDGYSLDSDAQSIKKQQRLLTQNPAKISKPSSWSSPSPVSVYSSDNESQFTYDNIPGTNKPAVSALGPSSSAESLEATDDDELVLKADPKMTRMVGVAGPSVVRQAPTEVFSPPYTKGYVVQTPSRAFSSDDEDSFVVPPLESKERMTKGFEEVENEERESLPFDESVEDSVDQDLDVFSAELEKIKRDIASRRLEHSLSDDDRTRLMANPRR